MDVVIVGAGISGLASAISLRRSGHNVTIYERSSMNNEVGAAINVPPNISRCLIPWGLDAKKYGFVESNGMYFMDPRTKVEWASHSHEKTREIWGEALLYAHRVDLHESLKAMATAEEDEKNVGRKVEIKLKEGVIAYDTVNTSITLQSGLTVPADLVIAADGIHSLAPEAILGSANAPEVGRIVNCCYRFLIPRAAFLDDPETVWFTEGKGKGGCRVYPDSTMPRRLIAYYCRDFEVANFVAICYNENMNSNKEDWLASVDKSEVLEKYAGYHPSILAVINKATEVKRWPLLYRPPIRTWHKNNTVLVGDAAHPMLPHHAQAGAQAMMDGIALGLTMHGVASKSQIEERIVLYEKIRRNAASSIQVLSNFGFDEEVSDELVQYLEGREKPKSMKDIIGIEYGEDVVKRTVATMEEFDPSWKLPEGFFPAAKK